MQDHCVRDGGNRLQWLNIVDELASHTVEAIESLMKALTESGLVPVRMIWNNHQLFITMSERTLYSELRTKSRIYTISIPTRTILFPVLANFSTVFESLYLWRSTNEVEREKVHIKMIQDRFYIELCWLLWDGKAVSLWVASWLEIMQRLRWWCSNKILWASSLSNHYKIYRPMIFISQIITDSKLLISFAWASRDTSYLIERDPCPLRV